MADGSFIANGKTYSIPTDLTIGEMCDAEAAFQIELGNTDKSSMRVGAALVWIAMRREDPDVKPEDIRGLPMSLFEEMAADASPPEPRPAELNSISGGSSEPGTDTHEPLRDSGNHGSDIGSDSARETFYTSLRAS